MGKKIIPESANKTASIKYPKAPNFDYGSMRPCWRISNFDKNGPWGINSLLKFSFTYNEAILNILIEFQKEDLGAAFETLDGKPFDNKDAFWEKLKVLYDKDIPLVLISKIEDAIVNNVFIDKIYPKLIEFEKITWDEIRLQSHQSKGKMKSNNHNVKICDLGKLAIERLKNLKIEDRDEIYSLRLEGKIRIYGFKELNYLDILW